MARRYHELRCDVRFWHMADVQTALMNVRFEVNNGDADVDAMSANDPKRTAEACQTT